MKQLEITRASGETITLPMSRVLTIDKLGQTAKLDRTGKPPVFLTWIQGRCELLVDAPDSSETVAVKITRAEGQGAAGDAVIACLRATLK